MFYSPAPLILQTDCFHQLEYPPLGSCITCPDQEVTTACRAQSECELSHEAAINHIQPLQFKANEIVSAVPQSHRAAFQGLNCHMWLVATALNDRGVEHFPPYKKIHGRDPAQTSLTRVLPHPGLGDTFPCVSRACCPQRRPETSA